MKRKAIFFAALFLLLTTLTCLAQKKEKDKDINQKTPSEYGALLSRVQGGDLSIDFQKLRFSWMDSSERNTAKDTTDEEKAMYAALKAKDYKKAIASAEIVIANEFVNMDAHFIEYIAYEQLHEDKKSEFQKAVFDGLLKSIMQSGDGKSPQTAYVVISTHEEYVVLNVHGLLPGKQSLVNDSGHAYDLLEAKDSRTNQKVTLYFNVDIPFKHYLQ